MSSPLMHTEPSGIAVPDAGYAAAGTSADAVIAREAIVKVLRRTAKIFFMGNTLL